MKQPLRIIRQVTGDRALANQLLDKCGGDIDRARRVIRDLRRSTERTGWTNILSFKALFTHRGKYIVESFAAERRQERSEAATAEAGRRLQLENAYRDYCAKELDRWIEANPAEFDNRLRVAKHEAAAADRRCAAWPDETLAAFTRHRVRATLQKELPIMSLGEFATATRPENEPGPRGL